MRITQYIIAAGLASTTLFSYAGNKERIGQAGSSQLLINPWARSGGMGGAGSAYLNGTEAFNWNIAGLSAIETMEFNYSNLTLFTGSEISMNSVGFGVRTGESSVLGLSVNTMSFGELPITTVENPDGGQGTFSPQFLNLALGYSRMFSNSIQGGGSVRVVSESINNLGATGISLDAGIRYVTGKNDRAKFGIALRNVGPKLRYSGDGLAQTVVISGNEFTVNQRSEGFEMPALLNMGASYDFYLFQNLGSTEGEEGEEVSSDDDALPSDYRLTTALTYTSNSFSPDQIRVGLEFAFMKYFAVRGGLLYEEALFKGYNLGRLNANTGPTVGTSLMLPFKKKENTGFSLDYSYRFANPLGGSHTVGLRLSI
ncbi:MAG: hypothetical protein Salg2KO_14150 [Salibacteraceae bacterium]